NLREHYALTVRHWLERLRERQDDAIRLAGPAMFRLWEMYLAAAVFHFETGSTNINQTLFLKSPDGRSPLPLTRDHLYERHLTSQRRSSIPAAARPEQGNG